MTCSSVSTKKFNDDWQVATGVYKARGRDALTAKESGDGVPSGGGVNVLTAQVVQNFAVQRPAVPFVGFVEVNRDLDRHRVLQHPCQRDSCERRAQTQQIVAANVRGEQRPLPRFEVGHCLEGVARESRKRATEAGYDQQSPSRIGEDALCSPCNEAPDYQAAGDVNDECAEGKTGPRNLAA